MYQKYDIMRKKLNSAFQLITPLLLICMSANLSFAQKGMQLENDISCTTVDQAVTIFPFDNDNLDNGSIDLSTFSIITNPTQGTAVWDPIRYVLKYSPNMATVGFDQIVYELCDDQGECSTAIVDIEIFDNTIVPIVDVFTFATSSFSGNVISNDVVSFSASNNYDVILVSGPSNGVLNLQTNGDFIYTQNPGFTGKDYFVYEICDMTNNICAETSVALHAIEIPTDADNYVLINDFGLTFTENTNFINYQLNRHNSIVNNAGLPVQYKLLTDASHGNLVLNSNGTFSYITDYDFTGKDVFTYEVCVGDICTPATIFIDVIEQNFACRRHFPVAQNNTVGVCNVEELNDNFKFNDLFYGYYDDTQISILNGPTNGSMTFDQDGNLTYLPDFDFEGIDRIEYEICEEDISIMQYDFIQSEDIMQVSVGGMNEITEETIYITENGVISDLKISLQLKHDAIEELQVNLIHPDGTVINLLNNACAGVANLNLTFAEGGATNIDCTISTEQTVQPLSSLSTLLSSQIQGEWTIQLIDNVENGNHGVLTAYTVQSTLQANNLRDCRSAWIEIPIINKNAISLDFELLDFQVELANNNSAYISWTSNEYGEALTYIIERSKNGISDWRSIGSVDAKNTLATAYNFNDKNLQAGKYYYRLRKLENDGKKYYSDVRVIEIDRQSSRGLISTLTDRTLQYEFGQEENVTIEIFNTSGMLIRQVAGTGRVQIDIARLETGMYISVVNSSNNTYSEKFFKK